MFMRELSITLMDCAYYRHFSYFSREKRETCSHEWNVKSGYIMVSIVRSLRALDPRTCCQVDCDENICLHFFLRAITIL